MYQHRAGLTAQRPVCLEHVTLLYAPNLLNMSVVNICNFARQTVDMKVCRPIPEVLSHQLLE